MTDREIHLQNKLDDCERREFLLRQQIEQLESELAEFRKDEEQRQKNRDTYTKILKEQLAEADNRTGAKGGNDAKD